MIGQFRFLEVLKVFSLSSVQSNLSTKKFGKEIVYFEEIGSTNDEAKRLARQGKPEGLLVLSDRQTNGKGCYGKRWFSPGKVGLYCSLILRPLLPLGEIQQLTLLAGAAVVDTIYKETSLRSYLKWPNDVLIDGRKVCGILTEIASYKSKVEFAALGIGVNINNNRNQFQDKISSSATSLKIETGKKISREKFLSSFLFFWELRYSCLLENGHKEIIQFWRDNNETLGRKVTISQGTRLISGLAKDIDDNGNLLVQLNNGAIVKVFSGELRWANPEVRLKAKKSSTRH